MSTKKAEVLIRGLKERLQLRFASTYIFTEGLDASGNPTLIVAQDASWLTTEQYAFIRIKPVDQIGLNSLGAAQESFGPHVAQLVLEESATAGLAFALEVTKDKIMFELARLGVIVEVYLSATTVKPVVGSITGTPVASLDDLLFPTTISM
jgi:hypothetical protein